MNLNRIKTLVEAYTTTDLEQKILELENCFVSEQQTYNHPPNPLCQDIATVEIDLGDYAKALNIRQQVEQQGLTFQEALRDLARRMRYFSSTSS